MTDKLENVNVKITKATWNDNYGSLRFETDKGNISWKAKKEVTENFRGLPVIKSKQANYEELPDKVFEIVRKINENGVCNAKVCYMTFEKEVDGETKIYRFLNSEKQINEWEIVGESVSSENKTIEAKSYNVWLEGFGNLDIQANTVENQEYLEKAIKLGDIFRVSPDVVRKMI